MPHSRKIVGTEDLYELRIQVGTNICRLFYFYYNGEIYIVLSGYIKKEQKTDRGEIDKALKLRDAYITAMKEAETNENGNV
jgi:phage-related protein